MNINKIKVRHLAGAIAIRLSENDAQKMALLINAALPSDTISIETMPLTGDDIHEYLIFAFSERILIPVRPRRPGSRSWDRILKFAPEEMFFMPDFARILFENTAATGTIDTEHAVRKAMSEYPAEFTDDALCFLKQMRSHTDSCMADGESMACIVGDASLACELNDLIDNCVAEGIMNPCSHGLDAQCRGWYEFHPCLYWDCRFQ